MARFDTIAVYMMTNRRYGLFYTGVTSDLVYRISQHRVGEGSEFTRKYRCTRLVWYEIHADIRIAIQREKSIKRYPKQWKIDLVEEMNPDWIDLHERIRPRPFPKDRRTIDEIRRGIFPSSDEDQSE